MVTDCKLVITPTRLSDIQNDHCLERQNLYSIDYMQKAK